MEVNEILVFLDLFDWLDVAFSDPGDTLSVSFSGFSGASTNSGEKWSDLIDCVVGVESPCREVFSTTVSVSGPSAAGKDMAKIMKRGGYGTRERKRRSTNLQARTRT